MTDNVTSEISALVLAFGIMISHTAIADDNTTIPSLETQDAIRALPVVPPSPPLGSTPEYLEIFVFPSEPEPVEPAIYPLSMSYPSILESLPYVYTVKQRVTSSPFANRNSMILRFEPNASPSQIGGYIDHRDLQVVRTFPEIGAIQIEIDLSSYIPREIAGNDPQQANQVLLRSLLAASEDFQSDPIVRSAAPDLLLGNQHDGDTIGDNLLTPVSVSLTGSEETVGWGIVDIEANRLWSHSDASESVVLGVLDFGFAEHEDLHFVDPLLNMVPHDHGNHVSGIACGRHNGRGIRGVLPDCSIRARFATPLVSELIETSDILALNFDDMDALNVSLGYNWHRRKLNPDESADLRMVIALASEALLPILELADKRGKVIFSAAGNDSSGLVTPINAKYASPFNWAAVTARERGIAQNGVIVEAHDVNGRRAEFSNGGGHLSCPGVDITSALTFVDPQRRVPDPSAYGIMSGTSMASPHCAGGYLLFRLIRPQYSSVESVDCLRRSSDTSTSGTPMLRLTQATDACPRKHEDE